MGTSGNIAYTTVIQGLVEILNVFFRHSRDLCDSEIYDAISVLANARLI